MEGAIPAIRVDQFRDRIREGVVYYIEVFNLWEAKKAYKAVDHPYHIGFTKRIQIREATPQPDNFPNFAYTALPFSLLANRVDQNEFLSG